MKTRSTHQAEITRLSHDGRGVAHCNGKTIFIDNALPGETVEYALLKRHKNFDEGAAVSVMNPSVQRVVPKCTSYSICGGCSFQHLASSAQIDEKQKVLAEQLKHIGGVTPLQWLEPLRGPSWGYRHKARLGVRYVEKKQQLFIGFREKYDSRLIADIKQCEILHPHVGHHVEKIKSIINELETKRHIPQIEIAIGDHVTALVIRHVLPLTDHDIKKLKELGQLHHYRIYLQPTNPSSIHCIWPESTPHLLSYYLDDYALEMQFHPSDFTQINPEINRQMVKLAIELLDCQPDDVIGDLFCGLGNFTLPLAKQCQQIFGIEGDPEMVQRAQHNARHNQIDNAQFHCTDLFNPTSLANFTLPELTKILLDPPRAGALEICQQIKQFNAQRIVYVSCNPATLARDAKEIVSHNYQLTAAGIIDQFPHTSHVEAIALFERQEKKRYGKN